MAGEHLGGRVSVVAVTGEIDLATVQSLEQQLGAAEGRDGRVIADLTDCTFLDGKGLRALTKAAARLEGPDGPLALVPGSPTTVKLFRITGSDEHVEIYQSLPDAVVGRE